MSPELSPIEVAALKFVSHYNGESCYGLEIRWSSTPHPKDPPLTMHLRRLQSLGLLDCQDCPDAPGIETWKLSGAGSDYLQSIK